MFFEFLAISTVAIAENKYIKYPTVIAWIRRRHKSSFAFDILARIGNRYGNFLVKTVSKTKCGS